MYMPIRGLNIMQNLLGNLKQRKETTGNQLYKKHPVKCIIVLPSIRSSKLVRRDYSNKENRMDRTLTTLPTVLFKSSYITNK